LSGETKYSEEYVTAVYNLSEVIILRLERFSATILNLLRRKYPGFSRVPKFGKAPTDATLPSAKFRVADKVL